MKNFRLSCSNFQMYKSCVYRDNLWFTQDHIRYDYQVHKQCKILWSWKIHRLSHILHTKLDYFLCIKRSISVWEFRVSKVFSTQLIAMQIVVLSYFYFFFNTVAVSIANIKNKFGAKKPHIPRRIVKESYTCLSSIIECANHQLENKTPSISSLWCTFPGGGRITIRNSVIRVSLIAQSQKITTIIASSFANFFHIKHLDF